MDTVLFIRNSPKGRITAAIVNGGPLVTLNDRPVGSSVYPTSDPVYTHAIGSDDGPRVSLLGAEVAAILAVCLLGKEVNADQIEKLLARVGAGRIAPPARDDSGAVAGGAPLSALRSDPNLPSIGAPKPAVSTPTPDEDPRPRLVYADKFEEQVAHLRAAHATDEQIAARLRAQVKGCSPADAVAITREIRKLSL